MARELIIIVHINNEHSEYWNSSAQCCWLLSASICIKTGGKNIRWFCDRALTFEAPDWLVFHGAPRGFLGSDGRQEKKDYSIFAFFFVVLHNVDSQLFSNTQNIHTQHPISPFIPSCSFLFPTVMQVWCGRWCVYMASIAQRCRSSMSSSSSSFLASGEERQKEKEVRLHWLSLAELCWFQASAESISAELEAKCLSLAQRETASWALNKCNKIRLPASLQVIRFTWCHLCLIHTKTQMQIWCLILNSAAHNPL